MFSFRETEMLIFFVFVCMLIIVNELYLIKSTTPIKLH